MHTKIRKPGTRSAGEYNSTFSGGREMYNPHISRMGWRSGRLREAFDHQRDDLLLNDNKDEIAMVSRFGQLPFCCNIRSQYTPPTSSSRPFTPTATNYRCSIAQVWRYILQQIPPTSERDRSLSQMSISNLGEGLEPRGGSYLPC